MRWLGYRPPAPETRTFAPITRVGVKELERWPNNWWQVSHLSGYPMLTIMFILVVGGGVLAFGVFVTVLICGIWGGFETDPSFPHSKVERGLHSSIDER